MRTRWFQIRQNPLQGEYKQDATDPIDDFLEKDSVSAAIMKLRADDRQLLILYYYQELPVREIAAIIGKSENAVIQRLSRARKRLKNILLEAGYEE